MLFISDVQYYILVRLCKTAGSIHLFKITGRLTAGKVKLNRHYMWDILEIDWSEGKVTFNGKTISLPKSIMVRIWDKFKVRQMLGSQPILLHLMLKKGFNWFTLTQDRQERGYCLNKTKILLFQKMAREISPVCDFIFSSLHTCL